MEFLVNDIVYMKKMHPCGSHNWQILRVGADIKIKCCKCEHIVMLPRAKFEKYAKKIVNNN